MKDKLAEIYYNLLLAFASIKTSYLLVSGFFSACLRMQTIAYIYILLMA